nr:MAG TPA: hypothetical protein [Caudoviricetes sp.]
MQKSCHKRNMSHGLSHFLERDGHTESPNKKM